ncbi:MAG TPA: hypothetical protein VME67_21815 [Mycobacterium sp.]|nr:hypothetical protein [Mycobacterium sp.]HTX97241.1 hypothetical protein [Mycobacterium sp.]
MAQRFDAVLLVTNLIHYPGMALRRAVLATVAHHLKPAGKAIIQWKPPAYWSARPAGWTETKAIGDATARVTVHSVFDGLVEAEYALIVDGSELRQCFHLEVLTVEELRRELVGAGLRLLNTSPESTEWLEVVRMASSPRRGPLLVYRCDDLASVTCQKSIPPAAPSIPPISA